MADILAPMGLRLNDAKTRVVHIDECFDFLGFRISAKEEAGSEKRYIYTYPSKASLAALKARVRALTRRSDHRSLRDLLYRLNPVLRGWAAYFCHGVSKQTFSYIGEFAWRRVVGWLRKRHPGASWASLRRRYLPGWRPTEGGVSLFDPATVTVSRYRYRGARIPTPWTKAMIGGATR